MAIKTLFNIIIVISIVALGVGLQYLRMEHTKIQRVNSAGSYNLTRFTPEGQYMEHYDIIERDPNALGHTFVYELTLFKNSPCSNKKDSLPPMERPCTPGYHYHVDQNVTITVIEGSMGYYLGDRTNVKTARRGQTVKIPYMTPYTFWSLTEGDLSIRVKVIPPLKAPLYLENYISLKRDAPHDLLNMWYTGLESGVYFGDYSVTMNRIFTILVDLVCKIAGKKAYYKEYSHYVPTGYAY